MTPPEARVPPPHAIRLARIRSSLTGFNLDALLVTHPPNLRYLTGFDGSMGALLIRAADTAERPHAAAGATLIVDGRYVTAARTRMGQTAGLTEVAVVLADRSHDASIVDAVRVAGVRRIGIEGGTMSVSRFERLRVALGGIASDGHPAGAPQLVPVERIVEQERLVKDASEIATLRAAAQMLSIAAREVAALVRPGRTEREIAGEADMALRRVGFERPAFETVVASGPNSALPHARPGDRVLQPGDGVVLDFGGVHDGYCVDLTRTVQLAPPTASFGRIFEAVRAAHAAALAAVAPGVRASRVDAAARELLAREGLADSFLHGTGHGLGLEIHEEPRVSRADRAARDETLRPGMVLTIEPGAYVAGVGGVRIEDDVLVVEGGCEVLTQVPLDGLS